MARVGLRDNAIMIYLGGVSAVFGAVIQSNNYLFLFIIPFLTLGVSAIVSNHQYFLSSHVSYSITEIGESLGRLGIKAKQWEISLAELNKIEKRTRWFGDLLYILLPSTIALGLNIQNFHTIWILFIIGSIALVIAFFLLLSAFKFRRKIMISTTKSNLKEQKTS